MAFHSKKQTFTFLVLFILGAWIRGLDVWRPVDGSAREIWRECDIASVAKNFYQESMNILYPRIDWRGDGPGFAEMEFPLFPWTVAVLYKILGYNEVIGRFLSYIFSLITLLVFFRLARYLLQPFSAMIASVFLVLSPVVIRVSNALQPEAMMLLFYTLAAYAYIRWLDDEKWLWFNVALAATSLAILAKVNAAHIGIFCFLLLLSQKGMRGLFRFRVWLFGVLSILPAGLWYLHAHKLWLTYGNSLGVSNEYHWVGLDLFTNPRFILGLAKVETWHVWMPFAGFVGLFAVWYGWSKRPVKTCTFWLIAVLAYYLITVRTTGDNWATYYHVVTIPAAALLFGEGVDFIKNQLGRNRIFQLSIIASLLISLGVILGRLFEVIHPDTFTSIVFSLLLSTGLVLVSFFSHKVRAGQNSLRGDVPTMRSIMIYFLQFCAISTFLFQGFRISVDLHPDRYQHSYRCAQSFKPQIPENVLIIASGGPSKDEFGYPVAMNASQMFLWLDRKGFNISYEDHSVEKIKDLIKRGARYFILDKDAASANPDFEKDLQVKFRLLEDCYDSLLYELVDEGTQR